MTNMVRVHHHPWRMHYARHDGEAEDVAAALNDSISRALPVMTRRSTWWPARWRSPIRWTPLAGIFGIGQHPKGDSTALRWVSCRRWACWRIIVEKNST